MRKLAEDSGTVIKCIFQRLSITFVSLSKLERIREETNSFIVTTPYTRKGNIGSPFIILFHIYYLVYMCIAHV